MTIFLVNLAQILLIILAAPMAAGIVKKMKARLQNRQGAGIFQPYRDLSKLFSKEMVLAENASWIFRAAPYIVFTSTVLAASVVPVIVVDSPFSWTADVIALAGFLAIGTFFTALAGMDIGTAFGGMGASREMTFAALAEPALLMSIFVLSVAAHSTNLSVMIHHILEAGLLLKPSIAFALIAMLMVSIVENGRIPVDNPGTHLEVTMIHESMLLEYSGRHLALIEWATQIKLVLFATLIFDLFFPWGISGTVAVSALLIALGLWVFKLILFFALLVIMETGLAKMRLFEVPQFLSTAFFLALLGMFMHYILEVGAQ